MAIVGYFKNEQISTNDTSLYNKILEQLEELRAAAPDKFDPDINLADYALLFTAMVKEKRVRAQLLT